MNNLRMYRKRAGLTLKNIVDLSDGKFTQSRLSLYETGRRQLTLDAAFELSKIVDATPAELLNISDKTENSIELGQYQEELFNVLAQISLRGDRDVLRVVSMLKAYLNP